MRPGTVAKSSTDTEAVQEYLALVAQHNGAWLKNMTTAFDSDDFLESITTFVVGTWGSREMARVLTELSTTTTASLACSVLLTERGSWHQTHCRAAALTS